MIALTKGEGMRILLLSLVVAAALAGTVRADDACTPQTARPVDLETLLAAPRAFEGQCVTVEGYKSFRSLFFDADDTVQKYASSKAQYARRRLGIYGPDELENAYYRKDVGTYLSVTGVIGQCDDLWRAPDVVLVIGYCHTSGGPFIDAREFHETREPLKNQEE